MSSIRPPSRHRSQQIRRSAKSRSMRPSRLATAVRVDDALRRSRSSMKRKVVQRISRVAIDSSKISGARSSQGTCHYSSVHSWMCSSPREKRQQSQNRATSVLSERFRCFGLISLVGMCRLRCSNPLARVGQFDPWAGENRLDMARFRISRAPVLHGGACNAGSMLFPRSATRLHPL